MSCWPSLSYRLVSSSAPSISYTYMSVSEMSTLEGKNTKPGFIQKHKVKLFFLSLFFLSHLYILNCSLSSGDHEE